MDEDQLLAYAKSVTNCFDVAGFVAYFYDYILTFDMEVQHVWRAPWNVGKVFFVFIRYLPFTDLPPILYHEFSPYITPEGCKIMYDWAAVSFSIGICVSDVILAFRTWAIWNKSTKCAILLAVVFICCWVPIFISDGLFTASLEFQTQLAGVEGCLVLRASNILSVGWALIMAYQFVIFSATLVKGVELFRQASGISSLMRTLYWDALTFSTLLFAVTLANTIVVLTVPVAYTDLLTLFQRAMHAILVCRILLHLRKESRESPSEALETTIVDLPPTDAEMRSELWLTDADYAMEHE